MGLELVIFIAAILFGIFLYWRESNGNGAYRALNKIINSKKLQMSKDNPKGFVYKQSLLPRIIFIVTIVLIAAIVVEFLTPLAVFSSYNGISMFASFAAGTLLGTYLASFVLKSSAVIEEKSESIGDIYDDVVEKGKDLIDDIKNRDNKAVEVAKEEIENESTKDLETEKKSARERLKDKGLM